MKSPLKDKILKIAILLLTVMTISIEAKSQLLNIDRFLTPIVNIIPESNNVEESPKKEITNARGYLDKGILIFKENLKICKDIVSGSSSSLREKSQDIPTSKKCAIYGDTTAKKQNSITLGKVLEPTEIFPAILKSGI